MKEITSKKRWNIFAHIILIIFSLIILLPLFWTIRTSFAPEVITYQHKLLFIHTFENYIDLFIRNKFGQHIVNSIIVSGVSTILTVIFSAPGAYVVVML